MKMEHRHEMSVQVVISGQLLYSVALGIALCTVHSPVLALFEVYSQNLRI